MWCSHCEGHDTSFAQTGILLTQKSLYSKLLIVLVKRKRISFPFWKLNGSFFIRTSIPLYRWTVCARFGVDWLSERCQIMPFLYYLSPWKKRDYILTISLSDKDAFLSSFVESSGDENVNSLQRDGRWTNTHARC